MPVGPAGVEFATVAHTELTNSYQDLVRVTVTAPSNGFVVLTACGYVEIVNPRGHAGAGVSSGTTSGGANSAETGVQLPLSAPVTGTYRLPFSLTTVVGVRRGNTRLYMVGIKDPGPHTGSANGLGLTALFVRERV